MLNDFYTRVEPLVEPTLPSLGSFAESPKAPAYDSDSDSLSPKQPREKHKKRKEHHRKEKHHRTSPDLSEENDPKEKKKKTKHSRPKDGHTSSSNSSHHEIKKLKQKIQKFEKDRLKNKNKIILKLEENNQLQRQLTEAEEKNKALLNATKDSIEALQNQKIKIRDLDNQNIKLKEEHQKLETELRNLQLRKKIAEDRRDDMGRLHLKSEADYRELKKQYDQDLKTWQTKIKTLELDTELKISTLKKEKQKENSDLKKENSDLKKENSDLKKENSSVQTQLQLKIQLLNQMNSTFIQQQNERQLITTEHQCILLHYEGETKKYFQLVNELLLINNNLMVERDQLRLELEKKPLNENKNLKIKNKLLKEGQKLFKKDMNKLNERINSLEKENKQMKEKENFFMESQIVLKKVTQEKDSLVQGQETMKKQLSQLTEEQKQLQERYTTTKRSLELFEQDQLEKEKNLTTRVQELLEERNDLTCVICLEVDRNTLLYPCQHLCVCHICSSNLKKCPRCDIVIQEKYFARIRETLI